MHQTAAPAAGRCNCRAAGAPGAGQVCSLAAGADQQPVLIVCQPNKHAGLRAAGCLPLGCCVRPWALGRASHSRVKPSCRGVRDTRQFCDAPAAPLLLFCDTLALLLFCVLCTAHVGPGSTPAWRCDSPDGFITAGWLHAQQAACVVAAPPCRGVRDATSSSCMLRSRGRHSRKGWHSCWRPLSPGGLTGDIQQLQQGQLWHKCRSGCRPPAAVCREVRVHVAPRAPAATPPQPPSPGGGGLWSGADAAGPERYTWQHHAVV